MAWTELTRRQHAREGDRYASDLTDAEWALIEPLVPRLRMTGPLANDASARCVRRDPLCRDDWLPVAHAAQRLSAGFTVRGYFYAWRKALRSYPDDGWLSEPSQGWGADAACQKIGISIASAQAWILIAHIRRVAHYLARS